MNRKERRRREFVVVQLPLTDRRVKPILNIFLLLVIGTEGDSFQQHQPLFNPQTFNLWLSIQLALYLPCLLTLSTIPISLYFFLCFSFSFFTRTPTIVEILLPAFFLHSPTLAHPGSYQNTQLHTLVSACKEHLEKDGRRKTKKDFFSEKG